MNWYALKVTDVFKELNSSRGGLTEIEAEARLKKYGYNEITEKKKIKSFQIFVSQFYSPLMWILLLAILASVLIGKQTDAAVIAAIVILNAFFGFIQEYRAEKSIQALKRLAGLRATVIRDSKEKEIRAEEIVPGDILVLNTGDKIAADARLIELVNLQTQEAALTGESLPIKKELAVLHESAVVGDRKNMVFSGTIITKGRAKALVTDTGMNTELGRIAKLIEETRQEPTPLQKKLKNLAKYLGLAVVSIAIIVFLAGLLRDIPAADIFLTSVALAVAAIPEGLPAVVTISLALGLQKMAKKNALIRKLPSVETLGACTVICSDKTGTLTHNEMTVKNIYVNQKVIKVSGSGYEPDGRFSDNPKNFDMLLKIGALNNDTKLRQQGDEWQVTGDPTEAALLVTARKAGISIKKLQEKYPRKKEIQFSSERKRMTTVHKMNNGLFALTKGAPDVLIELCSKILIDGKVRKLTKHDKRQILNQNKKFAGKALRVLGFAYKKIKESEKEENIENNMIFVGLQGMIDPPRKEAKEAISKCKKAGIKVIMITGDFEGTAVAVADEIGIKGKSVTGAELDRIHNLDKIVEDVVVYARVDPAHKTKIIDALRKKGHIIAMTGDGVNDAPALKSADIGIAMGITGTDVSKEASEMILTDDNFASIVNAVESGRTVYDNIKKFLALLLSGNIGEILIIFLAILIGFTDPSTGSAVLPLAAIQILWINLITDGLPALALGVDPAEKGIMERPPRSPKGSIFRGLGAFVFGYPIVMFIGVMFLFLKALASSGAVKAQTMVFTSVIMFELFQSFSCRSLTKSSFEVGIFANKYLLGAVALSVLLHLIILYTSFFQNLFKVISLDLLDWATIILVASTGFIYLEIYKLVTSKKRGR